MANNQNLKPFQKGFDPRRNLKGVPHDAVALRKHMRKIAAELIGNGETEMTRLDALLRQLFTSRNPAHNKIAIQLLYPKALAENVDVTTNGKDLPLTVVPYDYTAAAKAISARDEDDEKG